MAIGDFAKSRNLLSRKRLAKRDAVRRVLLETLEGRQLMAVGPTLVGVQSNEGNLLENGQVLQVSPNELVFRFDDAVGIDPASLDGIRVIRSGADGLFERAAVATDLGSNGQTLVEFYARDVGEAGNGLTVRFTKASRNDTRAPKVNVVGTVINIELNSNPVLQTRVQDLTQAFRIEGGLPVYALRLRGSDTLGIGVSTDTTRDYVLNGANTAKATSSLGFGSDISVQFLARESGNGGIGVNIRVTSRDRGGAASPVVSVTGTTINVEINSNSRFPTTLQEFITAINSADSLSSSLVEAKLISGSGAARLGSLPITYSPIVLSGVSDVEIVPGYIGLGPTGREVILRFAERLPQDQYRIEILGFGARALLNANGEAFNNGISRSIAFTLALGARIESVVPQPVTRNSTGALIQQRNQIDLYFNSDPLIDLNSIASINGTALASFQQLRTPFFIQSGDLITLKTGATLSPTVLDPNFYQLFYTSETLESRDDARFLPSGIRYYPEADRVNLIYPRALEELQNPIGGAALPISDMRLRVGTNEAAPLAPVTVDGIANEAGDQFGGALNLNGTWSPGAGGSQSLLVNSRIRNTTPFLLDFPGASDEPGNRENRYQDNLRLDADSVDGISTVNYNFQGNLGSVGNTPLLNAITEQQKQRVREVFSLYERYLGVRFVETTGLGLTVAVGDMRAITPFEDVIDSGVAGVLNQNAVGGTYYEAGTLVNGQLGAVLDIQDFSSSLLNEFGGSFQRAAMQAVGRLLGLGLADEVEGFTVQAFNSAFVPGVGSDITLPGDVDIVHGQYLYRPDSSDIDLYQFTLPVAGQISIETFAERMSQSSLLDSSIRLYRQNSQLGWDEVAFNDDYYSSDSFIQLDLAQGNYIVGVSSSGNNSYDPVIGNTGVGGRSQGDYQLRMDFRPPAQGVLRDGSGQAIDADSDGESDGVFNFWFRPAGPSNTKFVDKAATTAGAGTLAAPFRNIREALQAAVPGDVVRIVGNAGADGSMVTVADNLAYEIGFNSLGQALPDGSTFDVPKGVSVMIDAGAILKMRRSRVAVGSSSASVDRSGGSLLVLGTPKTLTQAGVVVKDAAGQPLVGSVYFTSASDTSIGKSANAAVVGITPAAGDWGGIDFRNRVDNADTTRVNNEAQGQFLNWVAHADVRYGGGQVVVDGLSQIVTPIQMIDSRPTVGHSTITRSADAAMSATPNSFLESNFHSPAEQVLSSTSFTVDYDRVGPSLYYNRLTDNSVNGLQVRIRTATGTQLETMTIPGRFNDTDIVHFLPENIVIGGTAGGAILVNEAPSSTSVVLRTVANGTLPAGTYNYRFTRVVNGVESAASEPTRSLTNFTSGSIGLTNLPVGVTRIYRSAADGSGPYVQLPYTPNTTSFTDNGTTLGTELASNLERYSARLDGRLAIDAGTIIKSQGSRIEVATGGQLIAEGDSGSPVVFTSYLDTRYGAGGTFNTSSIRNTAASAGDWGGIYVGHTSSASIDHGVVAFGGGTTRVEGGFSDFNALEVHQGDLRLTNSTIESNADGSSGTTSADRSGRGSNSTGTIFIRGAQPVIAGNIIQNNEGAAISVSANSLNYQIVSDTGRSRGAIDRFSSVTNHGPLIAQNRLANNEINGMVVRGGVLTTEGVWDDTDMVHVVLDEIVVSDHNHYGGLRLTSTPGQNLVVKLDGNTAGITARGVPLDNANRIGGSVQVIGLPNYPVILTSLSDNTVGVGFTPEGLPQRDTIPSEAGEGSRLPTGPEINNGLLIDNDVATTIPGFFSFEVGAGGRSNFGGGGGITAQGNTQLLIDANVVFAFENYVDVGSDGQALALGNTTITLQPTLVSPDLVASEGTFAGPNGLVTWRVESFFDNGIAKLNNELTLRSTAPLGNIRFINYLDEDVQGVSDDLLYFTGTPGEADFRAFTLDGPQRVGFAHGGIYSLTPGQLENASYVGWAADEFRDLQTAIETTGTQYTIPGNINTANLTPFVDAQLGNIFGLADVTTAFAWQIEPTATQSIVTTFLELVPRNPSLASTSGDWRSVLLDTHSNDRNVATVRESESADSLTINANNSTNSAQFLGALASSEKNGDENQRLGFHLIGSIATPKDVDVYSFVGIGGTEVWLDIDRTDNSLDTVIELVDADGRTLALSDSSLAEEADPTLLYRSADMAQFSVNPLRMSPRELYYTSAQGVPKDLYSTNARDGGMRVNLPGAAGASNLYHVRVRSSSLRQGDPLNNLLNPSSLTAGLTHGAYVLQMRLGETDEVPGSAVTYADIRFATNGLELRGVPGNSPLLGETGETETLTARNDTFNGAQYLGNLLATNRQAISLAGELDNLTDVDWFSFDIAYQRLTPSGLREYFATVFDMDYAHGIGRPDTSIYLFDANGNLLLGGLGSGLVDDLAGPLAGADNSDLSRGSAGALDPFVGSYELPSGRYFIAVTNSSMVPAALAGISDPNSSPLVRLQPIDSLQLIVDDHVSFSGGSTGVAPVQSSLFDTSTIVQHNLSDTVLYVTQTIGNATNLYLYNPFTGELRNQLSRGAFDVEDIAMRTNGTLQAFDRTINTPGTADPDTLLDYITIDTETGQFAGNTVTYETFHVNFTANPPDAVDANDGWNPEALVFANIGNVERGFMVANRPTPFGTVPAYVDPITGQTYTTSNVTATGGLARPGVSQFTNVVFEFNPNNGTAVSAANNPGLRKTGVARGVGPGTDIFERGRIETRSLTPAGAVITRSTQVVTKEVTSFTGGTLNRLIRDQDTFTLIDSSNFRTRFEFDLGPEVEVVNHQLVRDGMQFILDGVVYEFEISTGTPGVSAGATLVPLVPNATLRQFVDAIASVLPNNITVGFDSGRLNFSGATTGNFNQLQNAGIVIDQFTTGSVSGGNVPIRLLASDTAETIAARIVQTVNSLSIPGLSATATGSTIQFFGVEVENSGPLLLRGVAPGGLITGTAWVNGTMFAVSDEGGLYAVGANDLVGYGGTRNIGQYVLDSYELRGIEFTALSVGPQLNNGTGLSQILFGLDSRGNLHAFDTSGRLQRVFANGATSVFTGVFGANGLAFSTLTSNLWHQTNRRSTDPGHGIDATRNNSRQGIFGGNSWYFGREVNGVPNDYNAPGGAAGAMESRNISLAGLNEADQPTLYFNYFLATEGASADLGLGDNANDWMRDSFRVYVNGDDGQWVLAATNNDPAHSGFNSGLTDDEFDPLLTGNDNVQPLFDNTGTWRQARVPLSQFAGQENVKIRIEFATAGGFGYGLTGGKGPEIRTVRGNRLVDGESLIVNGESFEIEMGPSLSLPSGNAIAQGDFVTIDGTKYVFTSGPGIAAPDVPVNYTQNMTSEQIANALRLAIVNNPPALTELPVNTYAVESNDLASLAESTGISGGNVRVRGTGEIGDNPNLVDDSQDVDVVRIDVDRGSVVNVEVKSQILGGTLDSFLRVFDSEGNALRINGQLVQNDNGSPSSIDSVLSFVAPKAGTYYIGVSSSGNSVYNANVSGNTLPGTSTGDYTLEIEVRRNFVPVVDGNRLQLSGADQVLLGSANIQLQGSLGASGVPLYLRIDMTAAQVAQELQRALAEYFANDVTSSYPIRSTDIVSLTGLNVTDGGPFGLTQSFVGDLFSAYNRGTAFDGTTPNSFQPGSLQSRANNFEGAYVDDFIIGLAGRGELVTGVTAGNTSFVTDPALSNTNPNKFNSEVLVGPYQLEIRGGEEYGTPSLPGFPVTIVNDSALNIDSRLSRGVAIQFNHSSTFIAGTTFTVSVGPRVITFEMDDENDGVGVQAGNVALPFNTMVVDAATGARKADSANVIAARFRDIINSVDVQLLLRGEVSATLLNGDRTGATSDTVVLIGEGDAQVPGTIGRRIVSDGKGGSNRERPQGQVVIDSTRVSNALNFGVSITAAPRDPATGASSSGTPRNTVTINSERLAPGAVIVNSEFLFNIAGGINVVGDAGGANVPAASVPFVRLVNNTVVGGSVSTVANTIPTIQNGVAFTTGNFAFADSVVAYTPGVPSPLAGLAVAADALGAPNYTGSGEPLVGEGVVSLGRGGVLTLQFTNNFLTGSNNSNPDLAVFEVGDSEEVFVEISVDGVNWTNVGRASGASPTIDIDNFGFNANSRLAFVRLTDVITQGALSGNTVGADIDSVGAISSVTADRYLAAGVGISVTSNSTATLLNNVLVNNASGINVDASSSSTVVGGTVFQFNTNNVAGSANVGQFPLVLSATVPLFVAPGTGNLYPTLASPVIDSTIDSLKDRASLVAVKNPLGLAASPILAPRFDINGQLRVDDPSVETPSGLGESVFKDRGAQERADFFGPSVTMSNPLDNDLAGLDLNSDPTVIELVGATPEYFDIRLIDGVEPSDPSRGSGLDHSSVSSASVLVFRNNDPLVEGLDYRFGYDSTSGVIRLQSLAGVWRGQSSYTIRFVNSTESGIVAKSGNQYADGDQISIIDSANSLTKFEIDLGYLVDIPVANGNAALVDGTTFTIDDGVRRVTFEIDNNSNFNSSNRQIALTSDLLSSATAAIKSAIEASGLTVAVNTVRDGRLQIQGSSSVSIDVQTSRLAISGRPGVQGTFGLQIPLAAGVPQGITDGQTFTINRGSGPVTFELDTNGSVIAGNIAVRIASNPTAAQLGAALVTAIDGAGIGLSPVFDGVSTVRLGGDANTRLTLTQTVLRQVGEAGDPASIRVNVPATASATQVAALIRSAIEAANLPGISITSFGSRLIVGGAVALSGVGAGQIGSIRDLAGNTLKPNQVDGSTTLSVLLGEGLDYGDAPSPWKSLDLDNGPRHKVVNGLSIGSTVTSDTDARVAGDLDDLTSFSLFAGFAGSKEVSVTNTTGRPGFLQAWIDFNGDGVFATTEQLTPAQGLQMTGSSSTTLPFRTPSTSKVGTTYARFRFSTDASSIALPEGYSADGEVEDIPVTIQGNPFTNTAWNLDVTGEGRVTPFDALQVIAWLNNPAKPRNLSLAIATFAPPFVDVNNDGRVSPEDVMAIIAYLNSRRASGEGEGESGSFDASSSISSASSGFTQETVLANNWAPSLFSSPAQQRTPTVAQSPVDTVLGQMDLLEAPQVAWRAGSQADQVWAEIGSDEELAETTLMDEILNDMLI